MNYGEQIINNSGFVVARNGVEPRPSLSFHSGVAGEAHERPRHFPEGGSRLPESRRGEAQIHPKRRNRIDPGNIIGYLGLGADHILAARNGVGFQTQAGNL